MKGQRKDTGFPLTTGGNDRRGEAGMTGGERRGETLPPLSFPTFLIGNPGIFPTQGYTNEETEERHWIPANNRRE